PWRERAKAVAVSRHDAGARQAGRECPIASRQQRSDGISGQALRGAVSDKGVVLQKLNMARGLADPHAAARLRRQGGDVFISQAGAQTIMDGGVMLDSIQAASGRRDPHHASGARADGRDEILVVKLPAELRPLKLLSLADI